MTGVFRVLAEGDFFREMTEQADGKMKTGLYLPMKEHLHQTEPNTTGRLRRFRAKLPSSIIGHDRPLLTDAHQPASAAMLDKFVWRAAEIHTAKPDEIAG